MKKKENECLKDTLAKVKDIRKFLKHHKNYFNLIDERDEVIKLAIENQLTLNQTQKLLTLSNKGLLYARIKRDAVIIYALSNGLSMTKLNLELEKLCEKRL